MCIHKINMEFIKHEKSGRCCKTKVYASMARKQGQLKMETIAPKEKARKFEKAFQS